MPAMVRAAVAALVLSAPAAQAAALLECRFAGDTSWVPTLVVVERGREGDSVTVFDPIIRHFRGRPMQAEVAVDNAARTTFKWSLRVEHRGQTATLDMRMTHLKRNDTAQITVQARGYVGPYMGRGSCRAKRGSI